MCAGSLFTSEPKQGEHFMTNVIPINGTSIFFSGTCEAEQKCFLFKGGEKALPTFQFGFMIPSCSRIGHKVSSGSVNVILLKR